MTDHSFDILTISDLRLLSALYDVVRRGAHVVINVGNDNLHLLARNFVVSENNMVFLDRHDDVRNASVWFSGTFEHVIPVRELLEKMDQGLLVEER